MAKVNVIAKCKNCDAEFIATTIEETELSYQTVYGTVYFHICLGEPETAFSLAGIGEVIRIEDISLGTKGRT